MPNDQGPFTGNGWTAEREWRQGALQVPAQPVPMARAQEIVRTAQERAQCGPWEDQLTRSMTQGEYHFIRDGWDTLPGTASFMTALYALAETAQDTR